MTPRLLSLSIILHGRPIVANLVVLPLYNLKPMPATVLSCASEYQEVQEMLRIDFAFL